jgi:hypothetical protein
MRILGFTKKWDKLRQDEFTTFRFPRLDRDWYVGEVVQVVYKPRSKAREVLGVARIISKEPRDITGWQQWSLPTMHPSVGQEEALADGFSSRDDMFEWLRKAHRGRGIHSNQINKLTLRWLEKE